MRDLAVAIVAGWATWTAAAVFRLKRLTRGRSVTRTLGASEDSALPGRPKRAMLEKLAARFADTRPGERLARYAQRNHPAIPFSDVFATALAGLLAGGMLGVIIFPLGPLPLLSALAGPVVADRYYIRKNGKRVARIEKDLSEALALQAAALRAGNSLVGSLRIMAGESSGPLGEEIAKTVSEVDLGHPLDSALRQLADRTASQDVGLWVTAMLVHRTTGGNLTVVAEALSRRVRERLHLKGEIRALTAQGRMSGLVVAAAPLGFLLLMSITSRDQMKALYETPTGWLFLTLGLGMEAAGFLWIRMLLKVRP